MSCINSIRKAIILIFALSFVTACSEDGYFEELAEFSDNGGGNVDDEKRDPDKNKWKCIKVV